MDALRGGLTFKGTQVEACYHPSPIPIYSHNAFIEALPPIWSSADAGQKMSRRPTYRDQDRELSPEIRLQLVQTIKHYVEPLPVHLELDRRFSRMVRDGYMPRNPITSEWRKQIRAGFSGLIQDEGGIEPIIRSNAAGFCIIGTSGVGKTTAIESVLSLYPQVITHTEYNGNLFNQQQLVWLKLDCPHDDSLKGLCLNFFQAVDDVLGTRYYVKHARRTVNELVPTMADVASVLGLGVLVIDEIQRLSTGDGADKILNFFVRLVNTIGVPIVLVGTYQALPILGSTFAQVRRAEGQGDLIWSNMPQDEVWNYLIQKLWRYQWTSTPTQLTAPLKKALHDESVGILDIAVKLYMLAQWAVIGSEDETICPQLIHEVASESLKLAKPILDALRNNDTSELKKIRDVYPLIESLDPFLKKAEQRVTLEGTLATLRNQQLGEGENSPTTIETEITHWLIQGGFEFDIATKATNKVLAIHAGQTDIDEARRDAFSTAMQLMMESNVETNKSKHEISNRSTRKKNVGKNHLPGSLISMFGEARKNKVLMYKMLEEGALLKAANEFFE